MYKHGQSKGDTLTPEYRSWRAMIARCEYKSQTAYPRYGGRGIKVCERWRHSFETFLSDMGKRPGPGFTVDRIDNNGDYSPKNCRWATRTVQRHNSSNMRYFVVRDGARVAAVDVAAANGISRSAFFCRVNTGWPVEAAATVPKMRRKQWRNQKGNRVYIDGERQRS